MLGWFRRKRAEEVQGEPPAALAGRMPVAMHWRSETRLPIADWGRMADGEDPRWDEATRHRYWTSAAETWLDTLADALPPGYEQRRSDDFLLLSTLPPRPAQLLLRFCQNTLRHIRGSLGELASDAGYGPYVVIVFADADAYYDYVAHYTPDGGEYTMSSGMFIHEGYGHFVTCVAELEHAEPVVAHELTHALLAHLPIPLWLNEGLAVNTEHALFPRLAAPRAALYSPDEMRARHAAFWNADSIQDFWSGRAFQQAGDGVMLAYDLARTITALAARDEPAFRAFVADAHWQDAGLAAEGELGYPLEHLLYAVLGEGDWAPRPERWGGALQEPARSDDHRNAVS